MLGLAVLAWALHRPSPEAAAKAFCDTLQARVDAQDARGVIALLHPAYHVSDHWGAELAEADAAGGDAQRDAEARDLARRGLALLMLQEGDALHLDYDLDAVTPDPATDRVAITLRLHVAGAAHQLVSPQTSHRLVLAWSGRFWPRLLVIDHDPIAVMR